MFARPVFSSDSSAELAGLQSMLQPPGKLPCVLLPGLDPSIASPGRSSSALALATIMTDAGGGVMFSK
jgi:hypothetical protein